MRMNKLCRPRELKLGHARASAAVLPPQSTWVPGSKLFVALESMALGPTQQILSNEGSDRPNWL